MSPEGAETVATEGVATSMAISATFSREVDSGVDARTILTV